MATDKVQAGLRLEYEEWCKITHIAKHNKRSLNAQIEFLVQNCINKYEAEHGPIHINDNE